MNLGKKYLFFFLILSSIICNSFAQKQKDVKSIIICHEAYCGNHSVFQFDRSGNLLSYKNFLDSAETTTEAIALFDSNSNVIYQSYGAVSLLASEFYYDTLGKLAMRLELTALYKEEKNLYDTIKILYAYDTINRLISESWYKAGKVYAINKWEYKNNDIITQHYNKDTTISPFGNKYKNYYNKKNKLKKTEVFYQYSDNPLALREKYTVLGYFQDGSVLIKKHRIKSKNEPVTMRIKPFTILFYSDQMPYYEQYKAILDKELKNKNNKVKYEYYQ